MNWPRNSSSSGPAARRKTSGRVKSSLSFLPNLLSVVFAAALLTSPSPGGGRFLNLSLRARCLEWVPPIIRIGAGYQPALLAWDAITSKCDAVAKRIRFAMAGSP